MHLPNAQILFKICSVSPYWFFSVAFFGIWNSAPHYYPSYIFKIEISCFNGLYKCMCSKNVRLHANTAKGKSICFRKNSVVCVQFFVCVSFLCKFFVVVSFYLSLRFFFSLHLPKYHLFAGCKVNICFAYDIRMDLLSVRAFVVSVTTFFYLLFLGCFILSTSNIYFLLQFLPFQFVSLFMSFVHVYACVCVYPRLDALPLVLHTICEFYNEKNFFWRKATNSLAWRQQFYAHVVKIVGNAVSFTLKIM